MKRIALKIILALGIGLAVSGCAGREKNEAVDLDGYSEHKIEFPSGNDEETEYNQEVLSVDAFTLNIALPDGWSVSEQADKDYGLMSCFSKNYIYDKNGECVGAVGYNVVPSDLAEDSLIPIAIYNQIALGNDYCFDVKEKYDVVSSSEKVETALTDVYYSPAITGGSQERKNKGIVSYDLTQGVYVAVEFEGDALSDQQYSHIANSLSFIGKSAAPIRLSETVCGYETLSYKEFKERTGNEAEFYHADLFMGEIPDSSLCIIYKGEYNEELGGPVLSDDDRPVRLQGTLGALMDGIDGKMSVTELTAALSEGDAAPAVCELLDGAGTAYYVGDRYADIQFDSNRDGEYDGQLLLSLENSEDEEVDSESTAWFEVLFVS